MNFTFDQYAEQLRRENRTVEDAVDSIRRTVKLFGPRLIQEEVQTARPRIPVDRGTYRRSFRYEDIPHGAALYNFAPHAPIIEAGRRPGTMPPIAAIEAWVRRKKIGKIIGPLRKGAGRGKANARAQRAAAFAIARAIKARGLPAHFIVQRASAQLARIVRRELAKTLADRGHSTHANPHG